MIAYIPGGRSVKDYATCKDCTAAQVDTIHCFICTLDKPTESFLKSQRSQAKPVRFGLDAFGLAEILVLIGFWLYSVARLVFSFVWTRSDMKRRPILTFMSTTTPMMRVRLMVVAMTMSPMLLVRLVPSGFEISSTSD